MTRVPDLRRRSLLLAMACVAAGLVTATMPAAAEGGAPVPPAPPSEETPRGRGESGGADPAEVREAVEADGSARVLVEFAVDGDVDLEAGLSAAEVRMQRRQIAAARDDVVAVLGDDATVVHAYRTIPAVALEIGAESLESLLDSPDVLSVMLDVPVPPALDYSAPTIEADVAHAAGADGDGFAVAILDTGVESSHPLFGGRVVAEGCFSTTWAAGGVESFCPSGVWGQTGTGAAADCPSSGANAVAGCGHGTHVAGIAAGGTRTISSGIYSGRTITGVAPKADIIAVQVFSKFPKTYSSCGGTNPCALSYNTDQLAGLEYVLSLTDTRRIAAVNMSLGGGSYSTTCDSGLQTVIANLKDKGVATVIATGNNGYTGTIASPACTEGAIAVSSTVAVGAPSYVSSFSNTDANLTDLYAPGYGILSSYAGGTYARLSGTSMATPQVTGTFAALREQAPDASVDEILAALKSTGVAVSQRRPGSLPNWLPATKAYFPSVGFSVPEIRINQARLLLATDAWKLTLSGTGRGTIATDSTSCTATCWVPVNGGASVTLTATPDSGSTFTGWSGGGCSGTGNCTVSPGAATAVTAEFSRTSNDSFAAATAIELGPTDTVLHVDTTGATVEAGETVSCTVSGSASVWFTYTAPVSGTVSLTTRNSNYPAIMRVYTGSSLGSLSSLACNDGSDYWSDGYNLWPQLYTNATVSFSAVAGTTYRIQIGGENGFTGLLKLTLDGPSTAGAPAKPSTSVSGVGEVTVAGTAPDGNGYAITGYAARCVDGSTVVSSTGASPTVEVTGLTPETEYDCSIRAQTTVGWSPWSRPQAVTAADVPEAPVAPAAEVAVGAVTLTATAPSGRGSSIIGYEARCTSTGSTTRTASGAGSSLTVSGMDKGKTYACSVRAENAAGWSEWSSSTTATMPDVPATPATPGPTVTGSSVTLTVTAPDNRGSSITGYEGRCASAGGDSATVASTGTSITITTLAGGEDYDCSVRAENLVGWSAWSDEVTVAVPAVPETPESPSVEVAPGTATLSFAAPMPKGSAIIGYQARCTSTGSTTRTASGAGSSLTVSGMDSGKTYACSVRAENGVGWSDWSSPASAVMPDVPETPAAPSVEVAPGAATVSIDPPPARGSTILGYEIRCSDGEAVVGTVAVDTEHVLDGLENGTTYSCSVRAENGVGWSDWSTAVAAVMPDVPATPVAPTLSTSAARIAVSAGVPAARGSSIVLHEAACSSAGVSTVTVSAAGPALVAVNLLPGRAYSCRTRALNAVGWSEWSVPSTARTPDVPSAPAAPRLASASRSVRVRLSAPAANGSPITLFQVECRRTGEKARVISIAAYSVTVTRLASRKRYSCRARAENAVGWSAWSRAATVTPR